MDFRLSSLQIARKRSSACWIFVGFRAALNVCSHPKDHIDQRIEAANRSYRERVIPARAASAKKAEQEREDFDAKQRELKEKASKLSKPLDYQP